MKVEILYRDLYDRSGQMFITEMIDEYNYCLVDYGDVMRKNISNQTTIGIEIRSYLDKGELIPNQLTFEVIRQELQTKNSNEVLIKGYPKNKIQVELLLNYFHLTNSELKKVWYMKAMNTMINLEKVTKYSQMAAKYKSHDHIKLSSERIKSANQNSIEQLKKYCEVVIFESESYGINYKKDLQRIKETIHNNR